MDAWQKGGTFEGKTVTDDQVLAYWAARLAQLSPTDPLYDAYKQTHDQIDYNINESKQGLLYAQGKITDAQMAQFYINWSQKVPKDSDFWRQLQTDAAKFMQSAKARGRAGAASASSSAYSSSQNATYTDQVALGDTLTSILTDLARNYSSPPIIGQEQDLTDFLLDGQNDPGRMDQLIKDINGAMKTNPDAWSGVVAAIRAADPTWDGSLTPEYWSAAVKAQAQGWATMAAAATKAGFTTEANKYTKNAAAAGKVGVTVASLPVAAAYSLARERFDAVWKAPGVTDKDKSNAAAAFAKDIDGLVGLPGLSLFQANSLRADAAALRGDTTATGAPSFYENYLGNQGVKLGSTGASGEQTGENAKFAKAVSEQSYWQSQYDANPGAYTWAHYTTDSQGNRVFDASGAGPIGIVSEYSATADPQLTTTVPVATATGGVILMRTNVTNVVVTDALGNETTVGQAIATSSGGVTTTIYSITHSDGTTAWTGVWPYSDQVTRTVEKDGTIKLTWNATGNQQDQANELAIKYDQSMIASDFADNKPPPPDGKTWKHTDAKGVTTTITWTGGHFTTETSDKPNGITTPPVAYEPDRTTLGVSGGVLETSRLVAGPNSRTDFATPIMAQLASTRAFGDTAVSAWQSPAFQATLQAQEQVAARDASGNVDPAKLQQLAAIDAATVRQLAGSSSADFGPNTAAPAWVRGYIASERSRAISDSYNPNLTAANKADSRSEGHRPGGSIKLPTAPFVPSMGTDFPQGKLADDGGLISPSHVALSQPPPVARDTDRQFSPTPIVIPTSTVTPPPPPLSGVSSKVAGYVPPPSYVPPPVSGGGGSGSKAL